MNRSFWLYKKKVNTSIVHFSGVSFISLFIYAYFNVLLSLFILLLLFSCFSHFVSILLRSILAVFAKSFHHLLAISICYSKYSYYLLLLYCFLCYQQNRYANDEKIQARQRKIMVIEK